VIPAISPKSSDPGAHVHPLNSLQKAWSPSSVVCKDIVYPNTSLVTAAWGPA
jgi:hypothetical protein